LGWHLPASGFISMYSATFLLQGQNFLQKIVVLEDEIKKIHS